MKQISSFGERFPCPTLLKRTADRLTTSQGWVGSPTAASSTGRIREKETNLDLPSFLSGAHKEWVKDVSGTATYIVSQQSITLNTGTSQRDEKEGGESCPGDWAGLFRCPWEGRLGRSSQRTGKPSTRV